MISNEDAKKVNYNEIGKKIILSSSFTGSTRYYQQLYQDSMAIVRWISNFAHGINFAHGYN